MRRRSGKHDTVSTALVGLYCSSVATIHHLRFPTSLAALSVCEGMAEEVEGIHRRASRDGPPGLKSGGKKGGGGQRGPLSVDALSRFVAIMPPLASLCVRTLIRVQNHYGYFVALLVELAALT